MRGCHSASKLRRGRIDIDRDINIDSWKLSQVSKTRNATFCLSAHLSIAIGSEALMHCADRTLKSYMVQPTTN